MHLYKHVHEYVVYKTLNRPCVNLSELTQYSTMKSYACVEAAFVMTVKCIHAHARKIYIRVCIFHLSEYAVRNLADVQGIMWCRKVTDLQLLTVNIKFFISS